MKHEELIWCLLMMDYIESLEQVFPDLSKVQTNLFILTFKQTLVIDENTGLKRFYSLNKVEELHQVRKFSQLFNGLKNFCTTMFQYSLRVFNENFSINHPF